MSYFSSSYSKFLHHAGRFYGISLLFAVPSTMIYTGLNQVFLTPVTCRNQPLNTTKYTCAEKTVDLWTTTFLNSMMGAPIGAIYPVSWPLFAWHQAELRDPKRFGMCHKSSSSRSASTDTGIGHSSTQEVTPNAPK